MILLQATDKHSSWIAALYSDESEGKSYLKKISKNPLLQIEKKEIPFDEFPVYAVSTPGTPGRYEIVDRTALVKRIAAVKRHDDDAQEYFTYFYFNEDYFIDPAVANDEPAVYKAVVNNSFLREYYDGYGERCVTREMLENLAYYVDVEGMDEYFEYCMDQGSDDDKAELAEAYMQMFGQMCYDYACNKYSYDGLQEIIPITEKIEALQGETLWELRADAYINLLEAAVEEDPDRISEYGEACMEALHENISEIGEEYIPYQKLSRVLHLLADHEEENSYKHWQAALAAIKKAAEIDPYEINWMYYLQLLYTPLAEDDEQILADLDKERKSFHARMETMQLIPGIHYRIASELHRLSEWGVYDIPEEDYFYWLDKSLEQGVAVNYDFPELSDAASFYHREGVQRQRLDLLERSLEYYMHQRTNEPRAGFTIYYIAKNLEDIGTVHLAKGNTEKADEYMSKSLAYYTEHEDVVKDNFSTLSHYGEFLERCYHYKGKTDRPSIEKIRSIARLAEQEGKGFYSGPFLLQARMALEEKNEPLAIFQLERSLLLHELCIDKQIVEFHEQYKDKAFPLLHAFLEKTLAFMKAVDEGYYYDPELKWPEIEKMNAAQTKQAWENRMKQIRNRQP